MKNIVICILIVTLLGGIGFYVINNKIVTFAFWKGYSSYDTFSKAVDVDEFLGKRVDENGFKALLGLAFLAQDGDKLSVDIVTGSKLTERYGVSETLRKDYNYLAKVSPIKGATNYAAYFNGDKWFVIKYKGE